jgi:polysaccharide pyruvyl transferase WcaK-like protein
LNLLIVGNIGSFNVGDDAILVAFLKWLSRQPDKVTNIFVFSRNNYLVDNLNQDLKDKISLVKNFDLLKAFLSSRYILICGGDYLDDFGALFTRIREFALLFSLSFATKLGLKNFLLLNNGIRANSHFGLSLERLILRFTKYVSVRDTASYELIKKYKSTVLGFDTAVLFANSMPNLVKNDRNFHRNQPIKVGVSITPFFKNFFSDPNKDIRLAKEMARSLARRDDIDIYFLAFNTSKESGDEHLINTIIGFLSIKSKKNIKVINYKGNILEFLDSLSKMDFILCCKYHSVLFSYVLQKPMLVLKYHPKTLALAKEIGLSSKAIMTVDDVLEGRLNVNISELLNDSGSFKAILPLNEAQMSAINGLKDCLSNN